MSFIMGCQIIFSTGDVFAIQNLAWNLQRRMLALDVFIHVSDCSKTRATSWADKTLVFLVLSSNMIIQSAFSEKLTVAPIITASKIG